MQVATGGADSPVAPERDSPVASPSRLALTSFRPEDMLEGTLVPARKSSCHGGPSSVLSFLVAAIGLIHVRASGARLGPRSGYSGNAVDRRWGSCIAVARAGARDPAHVGAV